MRKPTPEDRLLAWHTEALRNTEHPSHDGDPQCGWFKMQFVPNGPWVPVLIWCDQKIDDNGELTEPEVFRIKINGVDSGDPASRWTWLKPISRDEYHRILRDRAANPIPTNKPIDLSLKPTRPGEAA